MSDNQTSGNREQLRRKLARLLVVLAGIILGQVMLYGPSLAGLKILLPLDYLAASGIYLPRTPETAKIEIHHLQAPDQVLVSEPSRHFAVSEWRAGRIPMWTPYQFSGTPFVWPKFSPFYALQCCADSPIVLAWSQMAAAIVAGLGFYAFGRRVLRVSFWPPAVCAWCYPLTGFFILWQGYPTALPVYWLPWILLAVDKTVRHAHPLAPIGLSAVTCLVLVNRPDRLLPARCCWCPAFTGCGACWPFTAAGGFSRRREGRR